MENPESWVQIVAQVGFPVVVAGYLLIRMEGKLDKVTEAIAELSKNVALMTQVITKKDE